MDEVIIAKLKECDVGVHLADVILGHCEICGQLMPKHCIGWCPDCDKEQKQDPYDDFWAWGGWRRAFAEY